jgi:2-hydroxychromene-2-carboxylate isomerase
LSRLDLRGSRPPPQPIRWRPFLLGPVFAAQGWTSSPFNLYPAKGRNMWRDVGAVDRDAGRREAVLREGVGPGQRRQAEASGLAGDDYVRAVYTAEFARGQAIAEPGALSALLNDLGLEGARRPR